MKCVIPGVNVKVLAKAIHALAKIGDEMYIEPRNDAISFRTVNMANSAYADFTLFQSYFSFYDYGDLQENDALKCKISMRSAMTVFKAPNLIDKQVETCHIRLEAEASEILFILKYKNSITKTHLLPILDCEILQTQYDKESASNQLSSQPRVLGDALQNFHQNLIEITLEVSSQKLLLRNYVDDTSGLSNTTRTQLALGRGEFDRYDINGEKSITFCMKEFKAMLIFAENVGIPLSVYFEEAGRPVIFALKNPSFEANLVLSTLSADADSQTDTSIVENRKQEKSMKRNTGNKRGSRRPNRSASRIEKSIRVNKTSMNATARISNLHPALLEAQNETNQKTLKEKPSSSLNVSNKNVTDNQNNNRVGVTATEENQEESRNFPSSNRDTSTKRNKPSTSGRSLVNSVFSSITKRKSSNDIAEKEQSFNNDIPGVLEDEIPSSPPPPAKKARLIFQKCFQTTFDPTTLPGYDIVLAEDSDE